MYQSELDAYNKHHGTTLPLFRLAGYPEGERQGEHQTRENRLEGFALAAELTKLETMSKTKLYTFHYSKAEGGMVSKTEEELSDSEKQVLVERLQEAYDAAPFFAQEALLEALAGEAEDVEDVEEEPKPAESTPVPEALPANVPPVPEPPVSEMIPEPPVKDLPVEDVVKEEGKSEEKPKSKPKPKSKSKPTKSN